MRSVMSSEEARGNGDSANGLMQALASMILIPLAFAMWSAWTAWQAGEILATVCSLVVIVAAASLAIYLIAPARAKTP